MGQLSFTIDGLKHTAFVVDDSATPYVAIDGEVFELKKIDLRRVRRRQHNGEGNLTSTMREQVTKVLIGTGELVQRGQPLPVLEAMKMEIKITHRTTGASRRCWSSRSKWSIGGIT